ncbi:uncharacterized protein VTP21DRAFT_1548 [Calcarisporiella thermophila]|uniref:uncharacterized protein n=1 Tax=Calcarisporiella thermophila TaxID=911321 RepID=UPI003742431F
MNNDTEDIAALFQPTEASFVFHEHSTFYDQSSYIETSIVSRSEEKEEDAWNRIEQWLKKFYPDGPPPYEKTPSTLAVFSELMLLNEHQDELEKLSLQSFKETSYEYNAEAKRLNAILERLGIQSDSLSKQGANHLHTLSSIALTLGLGDVRLSSYQRALSALTLSSAQIKRQSATLESYAQTIRSWRLEADQKLARLKVILKECEAKRASEETKTADRYRSTETLSRKAREYRKRLEELEREYDENGIDSLRYSSLKHLEHQLEQLEAALVTKKNRLERLHDIPPDYTLARLKLQEQRQKLANLTEQRETLLNGIADQM